VFTGTHALDRHYSNNDFKITFWMVMWALLLYACIIGAGIGLYDLTDSNLLMNLCYFMPAIVVVTSEAYRWWAKNDYNLLPPIVTAEDVARHKRAQSEAFGQSMTPDLQIRRALSTPATAPVAAPTDAPSSPAKATTPTAGAAAASSVSGGSDGKEEVALSVDDPSLSRPKSLDDSKQVLPPLMVRMMEVVRQTHSPLARDKVIRERRCTDYLIFVAIFLDIALIAAMGFRISYYSSPTYIGYSISAILLIVLGTAIPIIKWFNSYRTTGGFFPVIIATGLVLAAWLATLWYVDLNDYVADGTYSETNAILALCGLSIAYPTIVLLVCGFYQYRDSGWKIAGNACVPTSLIIACTFVVGYLISVTIFYSTIWGTASLVFFVAFILLVVVLPAVTNRWALRIIYTILFMAAIAFATFIGRCLSGFSFCSRTSVH
jgi:hypothetical protein